MKEKETVNAWYSTHIFLIRRMEIYTGKTDIRICQEAPNEIQTTLPQRIINEDVTKESGTREYEEELEQE